MNKINCYIFTENYYFFKIKFFQVLPVDRHHDENLQ